MSPFLTALTLALVALQLTLPKRWAFLPLVIAALHTSYAMQVVPSFTVARLVIIAGILRLTILGDLRWSRRNPIDLTMAFFGIFLLLSGFGHEPTVVDATPIVARFRMAIDILGTYLCAKSYVTNLDDLKRIAKGTAIVLFPLALGMLYSKFAGGANLYAIVGGQAHSFTRNGTIRAMGPFGSPILAGTMGALLIPILTIIWKDHRNIAIFGFINCTILIFSTGSSTPIGASMIAVFALYMWKYRYNTKSIVRYGLVLLLVLHFIKNRPIWYLIALTDFTGGSTGWHRARLIDQALAHIDEWWLYGTNYTKHWMPYFLTPTHVDLTNYYIHLGVIGGIPLLLMLVILIRNGFKTISNTLTLQREHNDPNEFQTWCTGALLFTHTLTCLTISYFDNTYIFFYMLIAFTSNQHNPEHTHTEIQKKTYTNATFNN